MLKGVYLGACRAFHENYDLDYNDIVPGYHINIVDDMLNVDLSKYDFIIATPPCNWWSRANYRRDISDYSIKSKHLLPGILVKCINLGKPFIIENVRNYKRFKDYGIIDICNRSGVFVYEYGRHTYFTNIMFSCYNIPQIKDNIQSISNSMSIYRQGGYNVHQVIDFWLSIVNF